jgi:hypothetical protein
VFRRDLGQYLATERPLDESAPPIPMVAALIVLRPSFIPAGTYMSWASRGAAHNRRTHDDDKLRTQ